MNLNSNETETPEDQLEEYALKLLVEQCHVVAQQVTSQPGTVDMTVTYLSAYRRLPAW